MEGLEELGSLSLDDPSVKTEPTSSLGVLGNLGITDNQVSDQQLVTA
jgi:hypothetical protein